MPTASRRGQEDAQTCGTPSFVKRSVGSQKSIDNCECSLECCQPQSLVLAATNSNASREQIFEPAEILFSVGCVDRNDISDRVSLTLLELPQLTLAPPSICALLCRWRH